MKIFTQNAILLKIHAPNQYKMILKHEEIMLL